MKHAIVVDANDIKAILAQHFNVPESDVIKSQYSYTVITQKEVSNENNNRIYGAAEG